MRILLIAHEFPPIPSAQSLRWAYLVRELAFQGHQIHVLAPDHPGYGPKGGLPEWMDSVIVHRTFPGPFAWLLTHRPRRLRSTAASRLQVDAKSANFLAEVVPSAPVILNWKGRLLARISKVYAAAFFPDVRSEWNPWARRALGPLLNTFAPDVVIVSHEPAGTLPLGLLAKRRGYRLVADLGDPVYASYTPRRWRQRALNLERRVCNEANLVTVTTDATRELLCARHAIQPSKIHVMTQGFDGSLVNRSCHAPVVVMDQNRLELLYTGSFYSFRRSDQLVDAVTRTPGVRLNIASSAVPEPLVEAARLHPESIRLLGFLRHSDVLLIQRDAHLLVNLANDDPAQVPGKIYEYLGAQRPILHIGDHIADAAAILLKRVHAGWICNDDADAIAALLVQRLQERVQPPPLDRKARDEKAISRYAWSVHASELAKRIAALDDAQTN